MGTKEQIKDLEAELKKTKYNKRTQYHVGLVKAKIAHLKQTQETRGRSGPIFQGYAVKRSGDAAVILIGFPSVGKSTLLNILTGADSPVGAYDFTTLDVIPGMLVHNDAKIQILDVPGIVRGAAAGTGRGKEVLSVMRNADLVLILVDVNYPEHYTVLQQELYDAHLRLNQRRPDVTIVKKEKGGIDVGVTCKLTKTTIQTIKDILKEFKIVNAQVVIRDDITAEELIDVITRNKIYIPGITVLSKIDTVDTETLEKVRRRIKPDLEVSAGSGINIDELKDLIFRRLDFIRVYTKEVGKKADLDEPMIMPKKSTIKDMCNKLHKDFVSRFKFAKVWGTSAKFSGQKLSLQHVLKDKDIVEIHTA